ncbi:hypothetical protein StrepF001_25220 [Streptomyces sp. F001]|uniref:hypothetical protein n=1 Tax=Streptomyces sp. F001 TaxID=1510026 RepID=UPI00101E7707|nr:hypothetical protein [Streptomyces sp. F001]RZB16591.1 hypothetical protein StrepF001_25220 [Streptomyces sp. F001]
MPADEVTHGTEVDESRGRTGPRHAAPKKPLFTRFHMPAGKAIALAAMPTAVLMGMGFTPKLALAEDQPASRSLTADEYKDCVAALEEAENGSSESATPSPSASASESASADEAEPSPSASSDASPPSGSSDSSGSDSSSDSGADDEAEPTPSPSTSESRESEPAGGATAEPSPSESDKGVLETIGDAVTGVVDTITGASQETASPTPSPSASASPSASEAPSSGSSGSTEDSGKDTSDPLEETTDKVTDTVGDTVEDATGTASEAAEDASEAAEEAAASPTPSPSASATTDVDDCPVATDEEGGVDNTVPLPDDPWFLDASSLLLKGADYQGIVKVKTANGSVKEVLKYVISDGTDIGDLHQTVKDKQSGKTYHVQAAEGSTSTIRDGETVMYTESISGNLLGLIPVTFDPEHPPPLNIPLIYFTNVKVQQAGQFGGTLHVPGLHQYVTD